MAFTRNRMIGFMLYRFFISSWMRGKTKSQAAIGVVLPVTGVAIGVASFTIVLSIMGGFVANLKQRLLGIEPHIEVIKKEDFGYLPASNDLLKQIQAISGIRSASPYQTGDAILQSGTRPVTIVLNGIDSANTEVFQRFAPYLQKSSSFANLGHDAVARSGSAQDGNKGEEGSFPSVILGIGVARALDVRIGDRVTFVSTVPEEGPFGVAPKQSPAVVIDVLNTGSARYDGKIVFSSLSFANSFFGSGEGWAGIQVLLERPEDTETMTPIINDKMVAFSARAKPWTESNSALLRALKLERWGMSFVLYMVILVGCFTITITLVLSVKRKAREMAILRAVGFERTELGLVYLLQGLLIGAVGVTIGLGIGFLTLKILGSTELPFVNNAYNGKPFPVLVDWGDTLRVVLGSIVLSALASVWPAWEVMRIDVVQTLSDRG